LDLARTVCRKWKLGHVMIEGAVNEMSIAYLMGPAVMILLGIALSVAAHYARHGRPDYRTGGLPLRRPGTSSTLNDSRGAALRPVSLAALHDWQVRGCRLASGRSAPATAVSACALHRPGCGLQPHRIGSGAPNRKIVKRRSDLDRAPK
jgi:hypothetical protein